MSKDSNKNNLEDFFRNSLKNYSENPSNDLWDRIEENIPPKPSRRLKPAYALLALLLLLTLGFGYEYFQFKNQLVTVNETVNAQKEELDDLKNQLEIVKEQIKTTLQPSNDEKFTKAAIQPSYPKKSENSTLSENTSLNKDAVVFNAESDKRTTEQTKSKEIVAESESTFENSNISDEAINALNFITVKPIVAEYAIYKELPLLAVPKKKDKSFSLEAYTTVSKTFPNNSAKTDNQSKAKNRQLSFDYGGLFNLGLNRNWDIQIGVGFNRMVINDAVYADLIYARDEPDPSRDGTYTSLYSYTVNTPAGEMIVNTLLSNQRINDGRDLKEGDPFQLELQYQNEISYFQVPLFVRYKIGKGKYRFTLKSGFIQKFLLNEKIKLSSVNPEFDRLENDMSTISNNQTSASTTSVDAIFGAGTECRLSPKNSIHLQSTFSYSLQEIYPGLRPFSVGLQLGLQHKIGR